MRSTVICGLLVFLLVSAQAISAADAIPVIGTDFRIQFVKAGDELRLDSAASARAFGWEAKIVTPGRLLTICRETEGGVCIPIRLNESNHTRVGERYFVSAELLARALSFSVVSEDGSPAIKPTAVKSGEEISAYHAAWGKGRGFQVGQTVPDIPLYDLEGNEVRFSRFLGKQYILYCWASW